MRGADQQDGFGARRVGRETFFEQAAEQVAQRAEPAQHGRGQPPHQGPVAVGQAGQAEMGAFAGKLFVERHTLAQHAVNNVRGDAPGREARDFRLGRGSRSHHDPLLPQIVSLSRVLGKKGHNFTSLAMVSRSWKIAQRITTTG